MEEGRRDGGKREKEEMKVMVGFCHELTSRLKHGVEEEKIMRMGISLLPSSGPSQQPEPRLRVSGEDDDLGRAKDAVAQHHLHIEWQLRSYPEESLGLIVDCAVFDGHEGVGVKDNQGKEVANEVFSQSWLAAESMKNSKVLGVALVVINEVGTKGATGLSPPEILFGFHWGLWNRWLLSSLFGGSLVVEGGFHFGVNLPS